MPSRLALVAGEPGGVGPELCVRLAQRAHPGALVAIADPDTLRAAAARLHLPLRLRAPDAEAAPAFDRDAEQAVLGHREIDDHRLGPDRGRQRRRAGLAALEDQADAESLAAAAAATHQVEVARLEDAQGQAAAREQHGAQREQRQLGHLSPPARPGSGAARPRSRRWT